MKHGLFFGLFLGCTALAAPAELPETLERWKAWRTLRVQTSPTRVETARRAVVDARAVMESSVSRSPSADYWRTKLRFEAIDGEVKSTSPSVSQLASIYRSLFSNEPGMEYPHVEVYRRAIMEFHDAVYFATLKDPQREFETRVEAILALAPLYEAKGRAADRVVLGRQVAWIARSQFAPSFADELYGRYAQPNELVQFHQRLIESEAKKPVAQTQSKTYTIQGRPTPTTSTTTGSTYLRLIPSETSAEVEVGMTGVIDSVSQSHAYQRRTSVDVTTVGRNDAHVSKRISVNGFGADKIVVHPAVARVTPQGSSSTILVTAKPAMPLLPRFLQVGRKVRESVAPGMAAKQIPAGQAEALGIAHRELAQNADQQKFETPPEVQNVVDQFQKLATEFVENVQRRSGVYPRRQWLATDEQWLWVKHVRHTETELGAFGKPPEFRGNDHTIRVRIHESEVSNTFNRQVAGLPYTDRDLEGFHRSVLNYVPEELRLGTHAPRWSTRFAADDPLLVDFDTDRIEFAIRMEGLSVRSGDETKTWKEPFTVRAVYRVRKKKDGPMLERLEEASVFRTGAEAEPLPKEMQAFLAAKAQAMFREELYFDGLTPVRGGIFEPLTKFVFQELRTENQWLLIGGVLDGNLVEIFKATPSGLGGNEKPVPGK